MTFCLEKKEEVYVGQQARVLEHLEDQGIVVAWAVLALPKKKKEGLLLFLIYLNSTCKMSTTKIRGKK
jgi:hypothetical protein